MNIATGGSTLAIISPSTTTVSATLIHSRPGPSQRALRLRECAHDHDVAPRRSAPLDQPARLASPEPPAQPEREDDPAQHRGQQRPVQRGHRHLERPRGAQRRPAPRHHHHAGAERHRGGEHAPVHSEPFIQREHRRHRDEKGHRPRALEVHERREHERPHHDPRRVRADRAQDRVDRRIEHPGVGDDAEEENGEDEHADHRREVLHAGRDEFARLRSESAGERGHRRHDDQRDERGDAPAHDRGEQNDECGQTEEGEHEAETISPVDRSRK
jgi:hypothetical protein